MRTVADLRRALIEETAELESRVELAGVRRLAQRRRLAKAGAAAAAAVVALVLALYAATGARSGIPEPLASDSAHPLPNVPLHVGAEVPLSVHATFFAMMGLDLHLRRDNSSQPYVPTFALGLELGGTPF